MTDDVATLGGGCFWCLEASYQLIKGVKSVVSGYAGGHTDNPSYEMVSSGITGHAEVVQITFNPNTVSYSQLLDIFWTIHNPTTLNRQGPDIGEQYRSLILYKNDTQKVQAEESRQKASLYWPDPIVTQIIELTKFWPTESYHQNYFKKNPEGAYCQAVINPKLSRLRKNFEKLLAN